MSKITLCHAPVACSLAPLLTLYEAGAEFDVKTVSLKNGEQRKPEYLAINPKGKVPALLVDGTLITECSAIMSWVAEAYPDRKLLPASGMDRIKALSIMAFCASTLHPPLSRLNSTTRFCDMPGAEESVKRLAVEEVKKGFHVADDIIGESVKAGREWVFGNWTAVDAYLFWVWRRFSLFGIAIPPNPNYDAHGQRMLERPSVKRAFELEKQIQAAGG